MAHMMIQGMVSVVVTSLMVWGSIPYFGTLDPLGVYPCTSYEPF